MKKRKQYSVRTSKLTDNEHVPEFYAVNKHKYINPRFINRNLQTRVVDTWPAHSSGILQPLRHIIVSNTHRIKVLDEQESKFPSLVPKPKLLEMIENHIKEELRKHKLTEIKPNELRLKIYSDAFEWLFKSLKSYRPLLAAIKQEYEMHIKFLRAEVRRVEPMKELLWTLSEEYDSKINKMTSVEGPKIVELKKDIKNIIKEIANLKDEKEKLSVEMDNLKNELEYESMNYRTEHDSRKLLLADMNEMRSKLKELSKIATKTNDDIKGDWFKYRWAVDEAKKTVTKTNKRIQELESKYVGVIPKYQYDECFYLLKETKDKVNAVKDNNQNLIYEIEALKHHHTAQIKQRDHLFLELKLKNNAKEKKAEESLDKMEDANLKNEVNKWTDLATILTNEQLTKRIHDELMKKDGSAEIMLEILKRLDFKDPLLRISSSSSEDFE